MKNLSLIPIFLILLLPFTLYAQPYHIDTSKPEPLALKLFDDPENEGVKLSSFEGTLEGEAQRFFIKDYSEYQPVDIFLVSRTEGEELDMQLVLATWNDKQLSCNTGSEGYCQVKFRNYGGVGLDIKGNEGTAYTILVVVGKEATPEFDSPFYKVSESDLDKLDDNASPDQQAESGDTSESASEGSSGGMNNLIFYVIAFFLLIIIVLLAIMVMRKNKGANILVILLLSVVVLQGQDPDAESRPRLEERIESAKEELDRFKSAQSLLGLPDVVKRIEELRKLKSTYEDLKSSYDGLGACIASSPPWTSPRIPSFCESTPSGTSTSGATSYRETCANCFLGARREFNKVRQTLAQLETIYKCTKKMTTSAKAFGDTWSSATKSGIGWVGARKNIEDSEKRLEKAYDNKYTELMQRLHDALIEMSACEAKYGLADWYDRFGFVYYEFMVDRYKRSN